MMRGTGKLGPGCAIVFLIGGSALASGQSESIQGRPSVGLSIAGSAASEYRSLLGLTDGNIVAWGRNDYGQTDIPAPNEGFISVAGGVWHSLGLRADGSIAAWGSNSLGQLVLRHHCFEE